MKAPAQPFRVNHHQAHSMRRKRCLMNRFLPLMSLLCLGLLAGCNVYVNPTPTPVPALNILDFSYKSNFSVAGQAAVCDNKTTQLTYTFRYEGNLESWSSYLKGDTLGKIVLPETFTPESTGISPSKPAEVIYNLPPNTAPFISSPSDNSADKVLPQAIVPVPNPQPIGTTRLYITFKGTDGQTQSRTSEAIPVVSNCS